MLRTGCSPTLGLTITKSLPCCVNEAEQNGFLNPPLLPPLRPHSFLLLGQQTLTLSPLKEDRGVKGKKTGERGIERQWLKEREHGDKGHEASGG